MVIIFDIIDNHLTWLNIVLIKNYKNTIEIISYLLDKFISFF